MLKYMDSSYKCILIAFLMVGLFLAVYLSYLQMSKKESFENTPKVRVCLFYATWCGHCERYLKSGIFEDTYKQIQAKNPNIVFEKIDYDENKNLASKYGVNSFPTIVAIDSSGKKLENFKGDRNNPDDLMQFALKQTL